MRYFPEFRLNIALACAAMLTLTACGGSDSATSTNPATPTAPIQQVAAKEMTSMERGRIMFKRCQACHTLNEGGKNKVGPNLWNVYGATAGAKDGFAYSKAMAASGVVWTEETMDAYIAKPREFMPGNRMSFVGIKKAEDRAALQEYLRAKTTPATAP
ncbi:c-type cytochrome [Litorimonas sp. RW-G-Af-16]|uniref:c-type cytochrome n=1 Tax=Litorimonas sp. RW-G-Af-16 TaxID=3241168 RepID=UPI00390CB6DD